MLGDNDKPVCRAKWSCSHHVSKWAKAQTLFTGWARHLSCEHIVSRARRCFRQLRESSHVDHVGSRPDSRSRIDHVSFWKTTVRGAENPLATGIHGITVWPAPSVIGRGEVREIVVG